MRLMLIDDDPRYRTLLRHHISCEWPDVDLVSYNPRVRGPLTPGFLAQGYSVVLLDHEWRGGSGLDWLKDFHGARGFRAGHFPVRRRRIARRRRGARRRRFRGDRQGEDQAHQAQRRDPARRRRAGQGAEPLAHVGGREDGAGFRGRAAQGLPAHRSDRQGFGVGTVPRRERRRSAAWWCSR